MLNLDSTDGFIETTNLIAVASMQRSGIEESNHCTVASMQRGGIEEQATYLLTSISLHFIETTKSDELLLPYNTRRGK
jgi:hypothetical protein